MSILLSLLRDVFFSKSQSSSSLHESSSAAAERMVELCSTKLSSGDIAGAEKIFADVWAQFPDDINVDGLSAKIVFAKCLEAAEKRFTGPQYLDWLYWFHEHLKPASYLEIGVESGHSLRLARSPTRSVGIDPAIKIVYSQESWVKLFKLTSDDFFATHNPQDVFAAKAINLTLIDGLHTFDQALKDFINVERFSDADSVVLFHDVFPVTHATATRNRNTVFWVGDTWKVMLILLKYRPDLKIFTIPTYPSGLGMVTGLNRDSRILIEYFDAICQEFMRLELDAFPPDIGSHLQLVENRFDAVARLLV